MKMIQFMPISQGKKKMKWSKHDSLMAQKILCWKTAVILSSTEDHFNQDQICGNWQKHRVKGNICCNHASYMRHLL